MSFIKTGDSEVMSIIKTSKDKDIVLPKCPKCGKFHKENESCKVEENERNGKNK